MILGVDAPVSGRVDGWVLTGRISPRRVVRAASVDAAGRALNVFSLVHPVSGAVPLTPWAVYLADRQGRFRLWCADLDAKGGAVAAGADADRLSGLLGGLGVPHLVCRSGPLGGRHVWVGLAEPVDADLVGVWARLLRGWLPSLDVSALLNPATGCVRPPGAPHRLGGVSEVLVGDVSVLTEPTVTVEQVRQVIGHLAKHHLANRHLATTGRGIDAASEGASRGGPSTLVGPASTTGPAPGVPAGGPAVSTVGRVVGESGGVPFLVGSRRGLSAPCRALLAESPAGDASAVLWRILCGAAAAHWRYDEVATLIDAPGLEHVRTVRDGTSRTARPSHGAGSPRAVLRRQWTRAVTTMAVLPPGERAGDDPTFDTRAEVVAAVVQAVQQRADAAPGRWGASRAALAQRRVLDAVCRFHLDAVRHDCVEADVRRLALACGLDRETVRRSLLALAADGWLQRTHPSVGPRGACWSIDPGGVVHRQIVGMLSQAVPRPAQVGAALRSIAQRELADRVALGGHDAFAGRGGLGIRLGSLYAHLDRPRTTSDAGRHFGWGNTTTRDVLDRLAAAGLIVSEQGHWRRSDPAQLDRVADEQHTTGRHRQRAELYARERAAWAWWRAELARLRAQRTRPHHHPHRGSRGTGPLALWPAHPRHHNGRADYRAARVTLHDTAPDRRRPDGHRPPATPWVPERRPHRRHARHCDSDQGPCHAPTRPGSSHRRWWTWITHASTVVTSRICPWAGVCEGVPGLCQHAQMDPLSTAKLTSYCIGSDNRRDMEQHGCE